ncbi:MAG: STAS domain-containing protein [Candidatus Omnitrophica bacterium]|nr:STAS domain-containing protein [Candidatus Omnitrophota bacterium]
MSIQVKFEKDMAIPCLEGNFDETSSRSVEEKMMECLSKDVKNIRFDMSKVKYVSSAGIRVLIIAYKKALKTGKKISLAAMSPKVEETIRTVGILPMFV